MTDANLSESLSERTYFVSADAANDARRSLALIIYNRQCWMCKRDVEIAQAIFASPQYFMEVIVDHCSQERDYLPPDTPMQEGIFRVLLAGCNKAMTAEVISADLSEKWSATQFQRDTSPRVIRRLLDTARDYYCVVSSDSGYEYKQKLGESVAPLGLEPEQAGEEDITDCGDSTDSGLDTGGDEESTDGSKAGDGEGPTDGLEAGDGEEPASGDLEIPDDEDDIEDLVDPFDRDADVWRPPPTASPEANAAHERLLYWISARGEGTWAQFRDAAQTLGVAEDRRAARSAIRRMILLGHLDRSADGQRWSASPAALVRLADDPDTVYLAGARVPSLLSGFTTRKTEQIHDAGPPRLDTDAAILQNLEAIRAFADAGVASERLADILPCVDVWKDTLKAVRIIPASFDVVEIWKDGDFRLCESLYTRDGRHTGESGMYQFGRSSDQSGRTQIAFFDEPRQKFLSGDWYGLRFLSIQAGEGAPQAIYDAENGALLIPESQRWPLLYERALTLASGLLPDRADNAAALRYPNLPRNVAETLCGKLNVNLTEK